MDYPYKIVINNRNLHREFQIPEGVEKSTLGTISGCDFRINADYFFTPIELSFIKKDGQWYVLCNEDVYLDFDSVRKLRYNTINHGDQFNVRYSESGAIAFELFFAIDFEVQIPSFNSRIKVGEGASLTIGDSGAESDLIFKSNYCQDAQILFKRANNKYVLEEIKSRHGVNANGTRINQSKTIKDHDFFSVSDTFFYVSDGFLYFDKDRVAPGTLRIESMETSDFTYPIFIRNTRLKSESDNSPIKVLNPSQKPTKPEVNIVTSLIPAIVMLILVIVLRGFMASSRGAYVLFSICSMALGVFTSAMSMIQNKKKYKADVEEREKTYNQYIERTENEIITARQEELKSLRDNYRNPKESIEKVLGFSSDIFDRIPEDDDYLDIFLGTGERPASKAIDYKKKDQLEEDDELSRIPQEISEKYKLIDDAPITLPIRFSNAIGITGKSDVRYSFFKYILADIVGRQFPGDFEIYLLLDEADQERFEWIKHLPQLKNEEGQRNVVCGGNSKTSVFERLYKELTYRSESKNVQFQHIIVFCINDNGIANHPLAKYIQRAAELSTTFVFFEDSANYLPLYCSEIIELSEDYTGIYYGSNDVNNCISFRFEDFKDSVMNQLILKVAPVYSKEISLESTLRKKYSMFEMLGIYDTNDLNIGELWNNSKVYESMAAPLGINSSNEIVYLDLHEKAHGPHGLVAGTTGSGKSELLQSFILSCAVHYHPYEIGFVIIDFKGGGMANQFKGLPHLLGAITNIDGKEINRSLKSIKAELLRRQELFSAAGVNQIDKYIKLYKAGSVAIPLPHLVIIVDEFAELKAEQPEFMKELISAARIGRSLGVHLILATQKPAGQVNEQIWSNSKFKLCLKVQDQQDSKEVIKSPLAAEIKEPGRAYFQVGNNELFELFQSAYSGGPAIRDAESSGKSFSIYEYGLTGRERTLIERKKRQKKDSGDSELEAIVRKIGKYCEESRVDRLPSICLPSLSDVYTYNDSNAQDPMTVPIGIYDDPDHQYQGLLTTDVYRENTIIVGSSQMGKTNLLQVILRFLAQNKTPEDVNVYILDFGAMSLKNFENLKHVGGVVLASEDEKVKNLFKLLQQELDSRKQKLLGAGVGSYFAYTDAGFNDMPKIILMLDNFNAFRELYIEKYEQDFVRICRDGVSLGISVVATNSSTTGIGYRYLSNFSNRLCLTCNETSDYGALLTRCRMEPKAVPGRILFQREKEIYEAQTFLSFDGEKEIDRANAIRRFVEDTNSKYSEYDQAKLIPSIPDTLLYKDFKKTYWSEIERYEIPLGLDFADIEPVVLNAREDCEIAIISKKREKTIWFLKSFIKTLQLSGKFEELKLFVIDDVERSLNYLKDVPNTSNYSIDSSEAEIMLDEIIEGLEAAKQRYLSAETNSELKSMHLFIVNSKEAVDYISTTKPIADKYKNLISNYKSYGVMFIYASIDNTAIPYNAPDILKRIKDNRKVLYLDNIKTIKLFDVTTSQIRTFSKDILQDEGYWINGTEIQKTKLIS